MPFPNYFQAAEIGFDQYGGLLPTPQELVIAGENVTFGEQNQDEAEWVADLVDPALDTGAGYTFFDGPSVRGPFSLGQVGAANVRCFIPPQPVSAASVGLGGWLPVALAGALWLAARRRWPAPQNR